MPFPNYVAGSASARYQNDNTGIAIYNAFSTVKAGNLLVIAVVNTGGLSPDVFRPFGFVLYKPHQDQAPHANMSIFTRVAVNDTVERAQQTQFGAEWFYYRPSMDLTTYPIISLQFMVEGNWTYGDSRIAGASGSGLNFPVLPVEECGRTFYITAVVGSETSPNNPSGMTIHAELTASGNDQNCFQLGSRDSVAAGYSNTLSHTNGAGAELLYAMSIRGTDPALAAENDNAWMSIAMADEDASSSAATGAAILLTI